MVIFTWNQVGSVLAALSVSYLGYWYILFWRKVKNGVNIKSLPVSFPTGNLGELRKEGLLQAIEKAISINDSGLGCLWVFTTQLIFISHWEDTKKVFLNCGRGEDSNSDSQGEGDVIFYMLGPGSIFAKRGNDWVVARRLLSKSFHFEHIKLMVPKINECCEALLQCFSVKRDKPKPWDMLQCMRALSMDIIGATAFSHDYKMIQSLSDSSVDTRLPDIFAHTLEESGARLFNVNPFYSMKMLWFPLKRNCDFVYGCSLLKNTALDLVKRRLADLEEAKYSEKPADLLQQILDTQDPASGVKFTNEEVRDNLVAILFAVFDTTSITLTHTLYLVAKHQEIQKKLQAEADEVFSRHEKVTYATITELVYCEAVVKEALRLFPTAPYTQRTARKDMELSGVKIKKGQHIMIPIWSIHHSEHNWKDAEKFDPDRFLKENDKNNPFYAWVPFSGGKRNCVGQRFSMLESTLSLGQMMRKFHFKLPEDFVYEMKAGHVISPKNGLPCYVTLRE